MPAAIDSLNVLNDMAALLRARGKRLDMVNLYLDRIA
jgi:hypothetical protein